VKIGIYQIRNLIDKKVAQYKNGNFIQQFESVSQARKEKNCSKISECLSGKRKTCGGFTWALVQ